MHSRYELGGGDGVRMPAAPEDDCWSAAPGGRRRTCGDLPICGEVLARARSSVRALPLPAAYGQLKVPGLGECALRCPSGGRLGAVAVGVGCHPEGGPARPRRAALPSLEYAT